MIVNHQQKCRGNFGSERIHRGSEFGRVRRSCRHAGNLTSDGLRVFEYEAQNRHSKTVVNDPDEGSKITYLHNALGQRVFKSEPKVDHVAPNATVLGQPFITWLQSNFGWLFAQAQLDATLGQAYVYDDAQLGSTPVLLGEYGNGGSNPAGRSEYIWLPTEDGQAIPIGLYKKFNLSAIHTDHLGTPRKVTNWNNNTDWQWPYSAFGEDKPVSTLTATTDPILVYTTDAATNTQLQAWPSPVSFNLRFAGQYFDSESNLNYNYFRSYQPTQGRYSQSDPIGLAGGLNRFGYVNGNPLSFIDPRGLQMMPTPIGPIPLPVPITPIPPTPLPPFKWPEILPDAFVDWVLDVCSTCPPCKTVSGKIVPTGTIGYRPMDTPTKPEHGIVGPHFNIYRANQNPKSCQCFWQSKGAVPPSGLPAGAIPIEPFAPN